MKWDDLINTHRRVLVQNARIVHFAGGEQGKRLLLTVEERALREQRRRQQRKILKENCADDSG